MQTSHSAASVILQLYFLLALFQLWYSFLFHSFLCDVQKKFSAMSFILEIWSRFDNCGLVVISTRLPRSRLRAMQPKFTRHAFDWFWLNIYHCSKKLGWRTILTLLEWKEDHKSKHIICNFWIFWCITSYVGTFVFRPLFGKLPFLLPWPWWPTIAFNGCVVVLLLISPWRLQILQKISCQFVARETNSLDFFPLFFRWHGKT